MYKARIGNEDSSSRGGISDLASVKDLKRWVGGVGGIDCRYCRLHSCNTKWAVMKNRDVHRWGCNYCMMRAYLCKLKKLNTFKKSLPSAAVWLLSFEKCGFDRDKRYHRKLEPKPTTIQKATHRFIYSHSQSGWDGEDAALKKKNTNEKHPNVQRCLAQAVVTIMANMIVPLKTDFYFHFLFPHRLGLIWCITGRLNTRNKQRSRILTAVHPLLKSEPYPASAFTLVNILEKQVVEVWLLNLERSDDCL